MSLGPAASLAAAVTASACLLAAPCLAGLTITVPDRAARHWWRPTRVRFGRRVAVAAVAVVLGGLAGAGAGWTALLPAFAVLALLGTPLMVIDVEHHRLPDRLLVPLGGAAAVLLTLAALPDGAWSALGRAGAAAAAVFAALFALNLASPRSFGMGDVKLGGILGGYLGWFGWPFALWGMFLGFVLGAMAAVGLVLARRATMRSAVPFGPALQLGALLTVLLGQA